MIVPERFKLVFMSFLAVFICYIDRVNISVAIIPMQEQFGWTESQVGLILGSFYFGYMFSMTLGGYLADKYGGKIVLAYGVFLWSIFTIITPAFAYSGFWLLIFIRILMGLGEGITFPSWHSLYARWIPFNERTRAIAITNSGISARHCIWIFSSSKNYCMYIHGSLSSIHLVCLGLYGFSTGKNLLPLCQRAILKF